MTAKAQIIGMLDHVPVAEMPVLLEVVRRFAEDDAILTADDIRAHEKALREYAAGETVSHEDMDWT